MTRDISFFRNKTTPELVDMQFMLNEGLANQCFTSLEEAEELDATLTLIEKVLSERQIGV